MHLINKIKRKIKPLLILCFGLAQAQGTLTPKILLSNTEISNRKYEVYTKEKHTIQLYIIDEKQKYKKTWEYAFLPDTEIINVLLGDISGNGNKELVVICYAIGQKSSIYVFTTDQNQPIGKPEIYPLQKIKKQSKPTQAEFLHWDKDKDQEIIIAFSSPDRKVVVFDYAINTIKTAESLAKEFLINSYGPIYINIIDEDADGQDEVFLFSNSQPPEMYFKKTGATTATTETFTAVKEKLATFFLFKQKDQLEILATTKNNELYSLKKEKAIKTEKFKTQQIYKIKRNRIVLVDEQGNLQIGTINEEGSALALEHKTSQQKNSKSNTALSNNKKELVLISSETTNPEILIINLEPPYTTTIYQKTPPENSLASKEITTKPEIQKTTKEETKTKTTKEKNNTKDTTRTDTLYVNEEEPLKILIPQHLGQSFQDLETIERPDALLLDIKEMSFMWTPTNQDIKEHVLKYEVTYNTETTLQQENINNQLTLSKTTKEKKETYRHVIVVNEKPKIIFKTKDTTHIASPYISTYKIKDKNEKNKHTITIKGKTENIPRFKNEEIFWEPTKNETGNNKFEITVSDGRGTTTTTLEIFVDEAQRKIKFEQELIATVDKEFIYKIPHQKGNQYKVVSGPENIRITKQGKIYWIPLITQIDTNKIVINIIKEPNKTENKHAILIYVNAPPIISYRPAQNEIIEQGKQFIFNCQSFDMNKKTTLEWTISSPQQIKPTISNEGKILYADTTTADNVAYKIQLSDKIDKDEFSGLLYINSKPEIVSTPPSHIDLGDTLKYNIVVQDENKEKPFFPDKKNQIYYTIQKGPKEAILHNNQLFWFPKAEHIGEKEIIISATDSIAFDTQEFKVFINDRPSITSIDSLSIQLGDTLRHLFDVKDLNQDTELIYNIKTTLDEILFSRKTGTLTWIPTKEDLGLHNLEISVSDGFSESGDTQKLKIFVYQLPKLLNVPNSEAFVNNEYKYIPHVIDMYNNIAPDTSIAIILIKEDTTNTADYTAKTNEVTWKPTMEEIGTHTLALIIQDQHGHQQKQAFQVQVILSPCEPNTTQADTIYTTTIDSVFIEKQDTIYQTKTDTIHTTTIDSVFIDRIDTIRVNIDNSNQEIEKKEASITQPYKESPFERNRKKKKTIRSKE